MLRLLRGVSTPKQTWWVGAGVGCALALLCPSLARCWKLVEALAGRLGFPEVSWLPRLLLPGPDVSLGCFGAAHLCSAVPVPVPAGLPRTAGHWRAADPCSLVSLAGWTVTPSTA